MRGNKDKRKQSTSDSYFNSRLYMRGNVVAHWEVQHEIISIHASTWEATYAPTLLNSQQLISIHASTWEATDLSANQYSALYISIHASTWEATAEAAAETKEESISIHASTWEATRTEYGFSKDDDISIHASTWEATGIVTGNCRLRFYFNSRLYMRGNNFPNSPIRRVNKISIHASTWEATLQKLLRKNQKKFQFTPLHERQQTQHLQSLGHSLFQFTPLHERQL